MAPLATLTRQPRLAGEKAKPSILLPKLKKKKKGGALRGVLKPPLLFAAYPP